MNKHAPTRTKYPKGFTLIETLVAITILVLSVGGPLYSAGRSLAVARGASNQLTASYLAQEGIEYVREMRDNEYLIANAANPGTASGFGTGGCGTATGVAWRKFRCNPNTDPWAITQCKGVNKCALPNPEKTDQTTRLIQCTDSGSQKCSNFPVPLSGSTVAYTRVIQITDLSTEMIVTSTVTWTYRGTNYTVKVSDHLTPWQ